MAVNIRQVNLGIGLKAQTDLATVNSNADFIRPTKINRALANVPLNTESNAEDLGKDDEFETQSFVTNWDMNDTWEMDATSEMLAWAFAFGLGSSVDSAPAVGAYRHTATPQSSGIDLPSFSICEKLPSDGSYLDRVMIGNVVQALTVQLNSGVGRQNAKLIVEVARTGKKTEPSSVTLPAVTTLHRLNAASATISINGTNYVTGGNIISCEFGYRNNVRLDQAFYPGSGVQSGGQIRGRMEHGDREIFLRFVARLRTSEDAFTKIANQTTGTAAITLQGALITGTTYHDMSATFHQVVFGTAVIAEDNGIATVQVECRVQKHASNGTITWYATNELPLVGIET